MDRPILHPLLERLRADERLTAFAAALPTRARVAEPGLALLLAALHEELARGLCVLLPDDADARDAAEAFTAALDCPANNAERACLESKLQACG